MNINLLPQFDQWNEKKKELHAKSSSDPVYFYEGDVWWCSVGLNIGKETFGKGNTFRRSVLILKKLSSDLCITLALTYIRKEGTWFVEIDFLKAKSYVMLNQIRMYDRKRLQRKIGEITRSDFILIKEKLENLLELPSYYHPAFTGIEGISPQSNTIIPEEEFRSIDCPFCAQKEAFIAEYFNNPYFA